MKDDEDILAERINDFLFISLGILSVSVSVVIIVYSSSMLISGQLVTDLLSRAIVAAIFILVGVGFFYVFRRKMIARNERKSSFFEN